MAVTPHQSFTDDVPDADGNWSVECPACGGVIATGWPSSQDAQAFADRHRARHQAILDATG
jgi:hypothetical protein